MADLPYIFNIGKINQTGTIKLAFKKMLYDDTANNLSTKGSELFEAIWGNNLGLRGSLWDDIPINPDEEDKNDYKVKFGDIVSSTSNIFFNFIKVK